MLTCNYSVFQVFVIMFSFNIKFPGYRVYIKRCVKTNKDVEKREEKDDSKSISSHAKENGGFVSDETK